MTDLMLSVCVITYNQEKFIAQTLDSILAQKQVLLYFIFMLCLYQIIFGRSFLLV